MRRPSRIAAALAALFLLAGPAAVRGQAAREIPGPLLSYPTGLALAADGTVWIASTYADQLVRVNPADGSRRTIQLAQRTHPIGLQVDARGAVWYAASGLGLVGRVAPDGRTVHEFALPAMQSARAAIPSPWALALDAGSRQVWFTVPSDGLVARVGQDAQPVKRGFVVTETRLDGPASRPEGIAVDARGVVWVAELGADRLASIDAQGTVSRLDLPPGSRPRGLAVAPDGTIWATLFGSGRLLAVDPRSRATRAWSLPAANGSNPLAVAVDGAGHVWMSDVTANAIVRFEPAGAAFTSYPLPTPRAEVRALAVDARGRVWFVGSYGGRLGVLDPAGGGR